MNLAIQGAGWVTPQGLGSSAGDNPLLLGPGKLPKLKSRDLLGEVHKRFGRFDDYTKAGFAAIALALRDAGLDQWTEKRPIGLVVSTQRGCLAMDEAYFQTAAPEGGAFASPNLFAYTLPNCMLGEAAIQFGLTGPSFVVDDTVPGHLGALHTAADLLDWKLCDTVVAGWCDVPAATVGEKDDDCGAVFAVLSKSENASSLQLDGGELVCHKQAVTDLTQLISLHD